MAPLSAPADINAATPAAAGNTANGIAANAPINAPRRASLKMHQGLNCFSFRASFNPKPTAPAAAPPRMMAAARPIGFARAATTTMPTTTAAAIEATDFQLHNPSGSAQFTGLFEEYWYRFNPAR